MKIHELKTEEPHFTDVACGIKPFEVRNNDRDFKLGDVLHLKQYNPSLHESRKFSGKSVLAKIHYILDDADYCKEGQVILGIEVISKHVRW